MNEMFGEIVENGVSNIDKLLICLAIILLLTIVWTILIGIMYKMKNGNTVTVKKTNRFLLDEDDEDEKIVVKETSVKTTNRAKKRTVKKNKTPKKTTARKTTTKAAASNVRVVKTTSSNNNQEVYVKVRFYRTNKDLIYVAPENVILRKGDKIKVRTDEGDIRTATVAKGNYLRDKYKNYEYQTLELVDYNK